MSVSASQGPQKSTVIKPIVGDSFSNPFTKMSNAEPSTARSFPTKVYILGNSVFEVFATGTSATPTPSTETKNTDANITKASTEETAATAYTYAEVEGLQPPSFLTLPQEIKDKIFNLLITNGHLEIMRTSKAVNASTHDSFKKAGALRFYFRKVELEGMNMRHILVELLPRKIDHISASKIRNIEVLIDFNKFDYNSRKCLDAMADIAWYAHNTQQITLNVILNNTLGTICAEDTYPYFTWIKGAKSFTKVYVTALSGEKKGSSVDHLYNARVARARNRETYVTLKEMLEPSLGPVDWHNRVTPEGDYLEFKPRMHWEAQTAKATANLPLLGIELLLGNLSWENVSWENLSWGHISFEDHDKGASEGQSG